MLNRKTNKVDVSKKPLGRAATEIVALLTGKNDPNFSQSEDRGSFVVVENIEKIILTGKKKDDKIYYRHSGYPGGLKKIPYEKLNEKNATVALKKAVYGMLPKNRLRKGRIKRLKVE